MKNDLISKQAAIDAFNTGVDELIVAGKGNAEAVEKYLNGVIDMIKELPSAQPEITHCAECIHWKHSAVRESYCEVFDWTNTAEDFCSFAERRTDDQRRSSKHN